jgi:hypothetical protein
MGNSGSGNQVIRRPEQRIEAVPRRRPMRPTGFEPVTFGFVDRHSKVGLAAAKARSDYAQFEGTVKGTETSLRDRSSVLIESMAVHGLLRSGGCGPKSAAIAARIANRFSIAIDPTALTRSGRACSDGLLVDSVSDRSPG